MPYGKTDTFFCCCCMFCNKKDFIILAMLYYLTYELYYYEEVAYCSLTLSLLEKEEYCHLKYNKNHLL